MHLFETLLATLFGATVFSLVAKRINVPYPTLLALGGAIITFFPLSPDFHLPPALILALFVAPVLLDAAYDTSLRDLRAKFKQWRSHAIWPQSLAQLLIGAHIAN